MKLFTKSGFHVALFTLFGLTIAQNQTTAELPSSLNTTSPRPPPSKSYRTDGTRANLY